MRSIAPAWLLALVFVPALCTAQTLQADSGAALSLDAAVRLALHSNASLQIARLDIDKADQEIAAARTHRLPSFEVGATASELLTPASFNFPAGALGTYSGTGPIPATDRLVTTPRQPIAYVSGQMLQPISQLVSIGLGTKAAEMSREMARERFRTQQLEVVNRVKRVYFAILQTESAQRSSDDALTLYREVVRTLQERLVQQVALRSDLLDVQLRLAEEELALTARRNTLMSQKEQLNQLLGRDIRTPFEVDGVPEIDPGSTVLADAQAEALDRRPDVAQARLAVRQAELDYRIKKAERIPEVSLSVSYASFFNVDLLPRNLATAGVQVKWMPFDWGRRGRQLATRALGIEQANHQVREAEDRALLDVNDRFRSLTLARARLLVTQAARQAVGEKLRVVSNQFQERAALLADVLKIRADASGADDRQQQALLEFWAAKADFAHALGEEEIR